MEEDKITKEDIIKALDKLKDLGKPLTEQDWKWHEELSEKIQHLIEAYRKVKEENREIKKEFAINTEIYKRDKIIKDLKETINCLHEEDKLFIRKSKIKEKIEELEKDMVLSETRQVLQEFLEEE